MHVQYNAARLTVAGPQASILHPAYDNPCLCTFYVSLPRTNVNHQQTEQTADEQANEDLSGRTETTPEASLESSLSVGSGLELRMTRNFTCTCL